MVVSAGTALWRNVHIETIYFSLDGHTEIPIAECRGWPATMLRRDFYGSPSVETNLEISRGEWKWLNSVSIILNIAALIAITIGSGVMFEYCIRKHKSSGAKKGRDDDS